MNFRILNPALNAGLVLLLGLTLFPSPVSGQIENHLILKKNGYVNKIHFLAGDPITLIRNGNDYTEEEFIQGIGKDFIIISGQTVPINKIDYIIRNRSGFNFRSSGKALMIAAPGYLVIGLINELFHQRGSKFNAGDLVPTRNNLIVAGSLVAAGLILPRFQVRKYPLGRKFSLFIVESDPALNK